MSTKQVKIYSTPTWPYCKMAKSFLDANNVPYQDIDVAQDKAGREELVTKSGQMVVPVIDINGELVIGFDQSKLKEKLGL